MTTVFIKSDFIKLDAFLKYAGIAGTGGEAKLLVKKGEISVDGELCLLRGRKLKDGSVVIGKGESFLVKQGDPP